MEALALQNISFSYHDKGRTVPVLEGIDVRVENGRFVSFIGPSGSGKSTLFKIIAGLLQPERGKVYLQNREVCARIGRVGYMPQRDLLMPWRTVLDNAILPLELRGMGKREARRRAERWLQDFGLQDFARAYPAHLSGGMRQRVAFLRTVMGGQDVLLLDEPFAALDAFTRREMQEWLLDIWEKLGKTILFITHDVEEAVFLADEVYVFSARPVRRLQRVSVPLPRPRREEMVTAPAFVSCKAQLLHELKQGLAGRCLP